MAVSSLSSPSPPSSATTTRNPLASRKRSAQCFLAVIASPFLVGVFFSGNIVPAIDRFLLHHGLNSVGSTLEKLVVGIHRRETTSSSVNLKTSTTAIYPTADSDALTEGPLSLPEDDRIRFQHVFDQIIGKDLDGIDPFVGLNLRVHLNGDSEACASSNDASVDLSTALRNGALQNEAHISLTKYTQWNWDSLLTAVLTTYFIQGIQCSPTPHTSSSPLTFADFCDAGVDHTPILPDHANLVRYLSGPAENWKGNTSSHLPCHFHTREGVRILSLPQLASYARQVNAAAAVERADRSCDAAAASTGNPQEEPLCQDTTIATANLDLYAVPAGRVFMFAPKFVGEIFELPHVLSPTTSPADSSKPPLVYLKTMSLSPRVFEVTNFFSQEEANSVVETALKETAESHRMKRSSTGATGYNLNSMRTSENAFVTHSAAALAIKERCFTVLGFDHYIDSFADGLQVLRYNVSKAYTSHLDWIDDYGKKEEHNFDSAGIGTNRFATFFLYLNDIPENGGGETVFPHAWPVDQAEEDHLDHPQALELVRKLDIHHALVQGSWEEKLAAECRSKLAVTPMHAKAILFYSQHPDGRPDQDSLHGACPVLDGTKWGANLWVWNGPRYGYPGAPVNHDVVEAKQRNNPQETSGPKQLLAIFTNTGVDPDYSLADLYFQDSFWGKFGHGDPPLSVNTYEGHEWNVMVDGQVMKTWIIDTRDRQEYVL